jgi:hypothetical protein
MNQDEELKHIFDLPAKKESTEVEVVPAPKGNLELETDFEYSRDNMYTAMEMQTEAMGEMLELAKASGHQRAFEVFGSMFSQYTDAQIKLMTLHHQKEKVNDARNKTVNNTTNVQQNVLVGSTKDLLSLVKRGQVKEDGEIVR